MEPGDAETTRNDRDLYQVKSPKQSPISWPRISYQTTVSDLKIAEYLKKILSQWTFSGRILNPFGDR